MEPNDESLLGIGSYLLSALVMGEPETLKK